MRVYLSTTSMSGRAQADIDGVRDADLFILYMQPEMGLTGAAVELGAALALGVPVAVVEQEAKFTHFFKNHPGLALVPSMGEALA